MPYEKLVEFILKLYDKTKNLKVTWEPTDAQNVFQVSFPEHSVRIGRYQSGEDVWYELSIHDSAGNEIESVHEGQLASYRANLGSKLRDLYELARRNALGVEQALDRIIKELGDDDDIPF